MASTLTLIFAEPVDPEAFLGVLVALGAQARPDEWDHAYWTRDGCALWVHLADGGQQVHLTVSRAKGSEWLAVEVIVAAADHWDFTISDFAGAEITLPDFHDRLANRSAVFFWPGGGGRYPSPFDERKARAESLVVLFAEEITPDEFRRFLRSLGARLDPDDRTDAVLCRDRVCVWVYLPAQGEIPIRPDLFGMFEYALDAPVRTALEIDVDQVKGADQIALEIVEAAAARWRLVVSGYEDQVVTVDGLRTRAATGLADLFRTEG